MCNNNDTITVSKITLVVLVFVTCWLLNVYRYLHVSVSPLVAYYQNACQRFTLTLNLLSYCILK